MVTGGGSGIGRCTAHELARLGAMVVLVGRNPQKLQDTAIEIVRRRRPRQLPRLRHPQRRRGQGHGGRHAVQAHGRIDALVNNAGGQYITPLEKISAKGWQAVIDTNLTGGFLVARECYLQSMAAHGGAIVNIVADMWGSMPGMGHSGAARMGMVELHRNRRAWSGRGAVCA
jgi:citronellol/citronellal dehydrogenase